MLVLHNNQLTDASPFTNLTSLYLSVNQLTNVSPLAKLTSLKDLSLHNNQLTDISPLANLTSLTGLSIDRNRLTDVSSLSNLTKLTDLSINNNQISDISPLIENTGISGTIRLKNNPLSNTALSTHIPALEARGITVEYDMPEGVVLFKDANLEKAIRDALGIPTELLKKEDLAGLTELRVDNKGKPESAKISDLTGLEHCISLTVLSLNHNQLTDLSRLTNLINLTQLELQYNQLSDISPLANLTNLTWLYLNGNQLTDLSELTKLTSLTKLWLGGNQLSEVSPLANLINLKELDLPHNQLSDVNLLASLTSLTTLWLHNNQLSEVSPLTNLANLTKLELQNNQIIDIIPLVENTGISGTINFKNNLLNNTSLSIHIPVLEARGITVEYDEPPADILTFKNSSFEASIRQALSIPTEILTKSSISAIVDLDLSNTSVVDLDLETLTAFPKLKTIISCRRLDCSFVYCQIHSFSFNWLSTGICNSDSDISS